MSHESSVLALADSSFALSKASLDALPCTAAMPFTIERGHQSIVPRRNAPGICCFWHPRLGGVHPRHLRQRPCHGDRGQLVEHAHK
eukprot:1720513-Prymnesium_polylepis.1